MASDYGLKKDNFGSNTYFLMRQHTWPHVADHVLLIKDDGDFASNLVKTFV